MANRAEKKTDSHLRRAEGCRLGKVCYIGERPTLSKQQCKLPKEKIIFMVKPNLVRVEFSIHMGHNWHGNAWKRRGVRGHPSSIDLKIKKARPELLE